MLLFSGNYESYFKEIYHDCFFEAIYNRKLIIKSS